MIVHPVIIFDVDTQRDFLLGDGALPIPGGKDLVPLVQRLAAYAFTHLVPVVSIVDAHTAHDPSFNRAPPHCVKGTQGQLKVEGTTLGNALIVPNDPECPPDEERLIAARQIILEKQGHNPFDNPHTELVLHCLAPRIVVAFGVPTDTCVRAGVLGLRSRGYQTLVLTDAIAGLTKASSDKALRAMRRAGAQFFTAAEFISLPDPAHLSL